MSATSGVDVYVRYKRWHRQTLGAELQHQGGWGSTVEAS